MFSTRDMLPAIKKSPAQKKVRQSVEKNQHEGLVQHKGSYGEIWGQSKKSKLCVDVD
jgi:hypothetical protein